MKKLLLLLAAALLLCSCSNRAVTRYDALAPTYEKHGPEAAIQEIQKKRDDLYGSNSDFLYYFDLGVLQHYSKDYDASIQSLAKAADIYEELYTVSVTNEVAATLTNDNTRPYRARPFELLLLYEFQVLNYLGRGDIDGAAVEVRRAQVAMEALYQKDNKKVNDNGFLRYLGALAYELQGETDDAAIAYYKTVQAYDESKHPLPREVWAFVNDRLTAADREDDLKAFKHDPLIMPKTRESRERMQEVILVAYGGHSPILGELSMSGTYVNGAALNLSYKDGATGKKKSFTMIAPPVPDASNGTTFHISLSLPQKKVLRSKVEGFRLTVDGKPEPLESMLDTDLELTQNLDDDWNTTIARSALRVALRTFAAQKAKQAMKTDNTFINLLTNLGTDAVQSQMEQADLRIGLFLPHNIYMTRIPVDDSAHNIEVVAVDRHGRPVGPPYQFKDVKVKPGKPKFLFVPAAQ